MSKFLDTQSISSELLHLIKEAKEKVILVSPFLKVNIQIQERLRTQGNIENLKEITIIYGKSELKKTEISWMSNINNLELFEKKNLHAKCYINENKAIICSMNLYDFSQQNNIEMGILITKKDDPEAYKEMISEINNLKINGVLHNLTSNNKSTPLSIMNNKFIELTLRQQLRKHFLKEYRQGKSKRTSLSTFRIFSNKQLDQIIKLKKLHLKDLEEILTIEQFSQYGKEILDNLEYSNKYNIGKIIETKYRINESEYDLVKLFDIENNTENWYDTTYKLPKKNKIVAVKLHSNWFNDFLYLNSPIK